MHGGLPIDDIEEVIVTSPKHIDDELTSLLEKHGIVYRTLDPDQYELNMDWVNERLAVGGSIHPKEIKALGPQGITHVVDTRAEHWDNKDTLACEKIDWLHLPTPDNHPLSIEDLRKGTDWVNERLTKGEHVLIHCEHGIGRSVLLTCAVLITQGMTASEALKLVKEQREQADPNPEQFAHLQEFEEMYRAGKLGKGDSQ
jgi:protein-tyrosine phosphatase